MSGPPPPPSQPNGIPGYGTDVVHPAPVPMDTSTEEQRERLLSVTEETRVLDEALSRTSTASLDGTTELAMARPKSEPVKGGAFEGGATSDRSNFEKLESSTGSEDMEVGVVSTEEEEVRGKPTSFGDSSQEAEESQVCKLCCVWAALNRSTNDV